jgi:hypothetical protein
MAALCQSLLRSRDTSRAALVVVPRVRRSIGRHEIGSAFRTSSALQAGRQPYGGHAAVAVPQLVSIVPAQRTREDSQTMERKEHEYGKPNANASEELSQFDFLIGNWRGEAKLKREEGTWESVKASCAGRYILDGYAIADEYRMTTAAGEQLVLVHEPPLVRWKGEDLELEMAECTGWNLDRPGTGGARWGCSRWKGHLVQYEGAGRARRVHARNVHQHLGRYFTWRGDRCDDGKTWEEFLVIELYRGGKCPRRLTRRVISFASI